MREQSRKSKIKRGVKRSDFPQRQNQINLKNMKKKVLLTATEKFTGFMIGSILLGAALAATTIGKDKIVNSLRGFKLVAEEGE